MFYFTQCESIANYTHHKTFSNTICMSLGEKKRNNKKQQCIHNSVLKKIYKTQWVNCQHGLVYFFQFGLFVFICKQLHDGAVPVCVGMMKTTATQPSTQIVTTSSVILTWLHMKTDTLKL